jgi:hypothetical protein
MSVPAVLFDGKPCGAPTSNVPHDGIREITFRVPSATLALAKTDVHEIKVTDADSDSMTVQRVEVSLEGAAGAAPKASPGT